MSRTGLHAHALRAAVLAGIAASGCAFGAVLFAACSSDPIAPAPDADTRDTAPPPIGECGLPFLGDPAKPMEIEIRALTATGADVAMKNGSDLALVFPPQGGRVSFVGIRAMNVDPCGVRLLGAVRDPRSQQVRIDGRTVNLQRAADGYGVTGLGNTDVTSDVAIAAYSNVPLCPNQWSDESIFDHEYELEVVVTDKGGRRGGAKITVTPRCSEPEREPQCKCFCKKGYVLGEPCGEDAGIVLEAGSDQ